MTPPLSIGSQVEVIGPSRNGECRFNKMRFTIDMIWNHEKEGMLFADAGSMPWYPASSLQLVEEELKIGDLVEIVGQPDGYPQTWDNEGKIDQIREAGSRGTFWLAKTALRYPTKSLRKLTLKEIQQHMQPKIELSQDALEKILERLSAIEKRQAEQQKKIVQFDGEIGDIRGSLSECWIESGDVEIGAKLREKDVMKRLDAMQKSISVLGGERPEVYESSLTKTGALAAMSMFGPVPTCVASAIRHETEEAEKRKQRGTFECVPKNELILLSIRRGEEMHTEALTCPAEAISWCEKVLDSMREG